MAPEGNMGVGRVGLPLPPSPIMYLSPQARISSQPEPLLRIAQSSIGSRVLGNHVRVEGSTTLIHIAFKRRKNGLKPVCGLKHIKIKVTCDKAFYEFRNSWARP